jgi:DNA-binding protein Alba
MYEKYNEKEEYEIFDKNCINVGFKDSSVYVLFGLKQILNNGNKEIIIQARGNNISKAIVVSEILKNNYMKDLFIRVETCSELIENNYIPVIKIHASKYACIM